MRYRRATFLPDGKGLVALSDESGEVEVWKLPANGVGPREQLTRDGKVLRWEAVPSPDGKWIAHHDKDRQLWLWSVEKKTDTLIATSRPGDVQDLAWSPGQPLARLHRAGRQHRSARCSSTASRAARRRR